MKIELNKANRVVIKIGSSIIDNKDDVSIYNICNGISVEYLKDNKEIILVTSGAISQGMKIMNIQERPKDIKKLQSLSNWSTEAYAYVLKKFFIIIIEQHKY